MRTRTLAAFGVPALMVVALAGGFRTTALAQAPGKSVWDGVYTEAQAARGKEIFLANCTMCHMEDLSGGRGPALVGDRFMNSYEADNVNRLYTAMRSRMPQTAPGTLPEGNYIDLVAYVLKSNAFPAGNEDLGKEPEILRNIRIGRKNAGPAPNFALVKLVGCLAQAGDAWTLSNASEPVVTKDQAPSREDDLKSATARDLGTGLFQLMSVGFTPSDTDKGHKVEVKGLLIRNPAGNRINLTSVQTVDPTCTVAP